MRKQNKHLNVIYSPICEVDATLFKINSIFN